MIRIEYPIEDVQEIQRVLLERLHLDASLSQCQDLWTHYCQTVGARWLMVATYHEDELADMLRDYLRHHGARFGVSEGMLR